MSEENIENMTKPDSNFAATSVNYKVLPDIFLIDSLYKKKTISIPEKVINIYILTY